MRMFKVVSNKYFQYPEDKSSVSLSSLFQRLASKHVVLSPCPLLRQQYNLSFAFPQLHWLAHSVLPPDCPSAPVQG